MTKVNVAEINLLMKKYWAYFYENFYAICRTTMPPSLVPLQALSITTAFKTLNHLPIAVSILVGATLMPRSLQFGPQTIAIIHATKTVQQAIVLRRCHHQRHHQRDRQLESRQVVRPLIPPRLPSPPMCPDPLQFCC